MMGAISVEPGAIDSAARSAALPGQQGEEGQERHFHQGGQFVGTGAVGGQGTVVAEKVDGLEFAVAEARLVLVDGDPVAEEAQVGKLHRDPDLLFALAQRVRRSPHPRAGARRPWRRTAPARCPSPVPAVASAKMAYIPRPCRSPPPRHGPPGANRRRGGQRPAPSSPRWACHRRGRHRTTRPGPERIPAGQRWWTWASWRRET